MASHRGEAAMRSAIVKWFGGTIVVTLAVLVAGFFVFAAFATRPLPTVTASAEGIVVLTGGPYRIQSAAKLLARSRGQRLLISGVNRVTSPTDLIRITDLPPSLFGCCVDIGYRALDTVGNAAETRDWVMRHGFKSIVVVTSRFHMPRSLAELARVLPETKLVAYPVAPPDATPTPWWQNLETAKLLVAEYLKFLPAAGRFAVASRACTQPRAAANPGSAPTEIGATPSGNS
ncbi:MAG: YdcF family protein [Pseudomonadota bacterium]